MNQAVERPVATPGTVRIDRIFATATGFLAGLVYLFTMARSVSFWDSGEYIACAWIAGIPHPPCVPLFVLLGRFFTIILGFIPGVAVRTNLMCVLAGAISMGLLARLAQRWSVRMGMSPSFYRPVSVAAGLLAAWSFTIWQNNNAMETYALSQSIAILAVWIFDIWIVRRSQNLPGDRQMYLVLYLLTLAVAVHLAALIAVPGIAVIYLLSAVRGQTRLWRDVRFISLALGLMILAFSVHLYMPVRAIQRPEINETDPSEWSAFRSALAREQYGQISVLDRKGPVHKQIAQYFRYLSWQSGPLQAWERILGEAGTPFFLVLRFAVTLSAIWGLILLWNRDRRVFLMVGAIFFMASAFFIFYLNFKTGPIATPTGEVRDRDYFYADSFALFALFAAFGAGAALSRAFRSDRAAWAVLALPAASLLGNYYECDRSGEFVARDYGINLLESCSEGAVLITNGDNDTFPLWFAQSVLGVRRDVIVSNLSLMNTNWYIYQLLDRDPTLLGFDEPGLVDSLRPIFVWGPHFFHVTSEGMPSLSDMDSRAMRSVFTQSWPWAVAAGGFHAALPTEGYGVQGSVGMQDLVLLSMVENSEVHGRDIYMAGTVTEESRTIVEPYLVTEGIAFRIGDVPGRDLVDTARSWDLMQSYLFTRLDDPGVYKCDQTLLLARNYVSAYFRLAHSHFARGEADSASMALDAAESLFVAMPDHWMQLLPTYSLLRARLTDAVSGSDSAAAYLVSTAARISEYASEAGDSRLGQTAAVLAQIAVDYQRERQLNEVVDSLVPGTAANTWMHVEAALFYGNYLGAWDRIRAREELTPDDPMTAMLRPELTRILSSLGQIDRFDISSSAISSIVQFGDSTDAQGIVETMSSMLAGGNAASAAACGMYFSTVMEDGRSARLIGDYADSIVEDPASACATARWFLLESSRTSPDILAWECAALNEPALCLAALSRMPDNGPALSAFLADPARFMARLRVPEEEPQAVAAAG